MTADWTQLVGRTMEICPSCGTELPPAVCHMTYSTWHCGGCGATLDGRVVQPKLVIRCENAWPDYRPLYDGEGVHPLACSCTGRGWYELDSFGMSGSAQRHGD
jgi:hypothetical protein